MQINYWKHTSLWEIIFIITLRDYLINGRRLPSHENSRQRTPICKYLLMLGNDWKWRDNTCHSFLLNSFFVNRKLLDNADTWAVLIGNFFYCLNVFSDQHLEPPVSTSLNESLRVGSSQPEGIMTKLNRRGWLASRAPSRPVTFTSKRMNTYMHASCIYNTYLKFKQKQTLVTCICPTWHKAHTPAKFIFLNVAFLKSERWPFSTSRVWSPYYLKPFSSSFAFVSTDLVIF